MTEINYFTAAEDYNNFKLNHLLNVYEKSPQYTRRFRWSERHLQCIWFDGKLRPSELKLASGERLTVSDSGRWNLEAGPDFLDAELVIQPSGRIIRGDVEIHIYHSDWDNHKHSDNPDYNNVVLHVTWFNSPAAKTIESSILTLSLAQPMQMRPWISIDDIDIGAYPHNTLPETPRPCQSLLNANIEYTRKLLLSAGYHRMQNKTLSITRRLEDGCDREQLFYEEFMAALGYKQNKTAFRILADKVPLARLSQSRDENLALLLGSAALLPNPDSVNNEEASLYLRHLWDIWWRSGGEAYQGSEWVLHNLRPNNHPVRRIAAAATLFSARPTLLEQIDTLCEKYSGKDLLKQTAALLTECCEWPFWNSRVLFNSETENGKRHALLGKKRISAILTNVIIPFYAAEKKLSTEAFDHLPAEDLSAPMRTAAWYLFGRDHNPAAYYTDNNLLQQGLLQIYLDFCLPARSGCQGCRLFHKIKEDLQWSSSS